MGADQEGKSEPQRTQRDTEEIKNSTLTNADDTDKKRQNLTTEARRHGEQQGPLFTVVAQESKAFYLEGPGKPTYAPSL